MGSPSTSSADRRQRLLVALGLAVSAVSLGLVVWWALRQPAPHLPADRGEWLWLGAGVLLYAVNTGLRGERWLRLLAEQDARAARADAQALNVIGYAANNVLPARAGDALRVLLLAPRCRASRRTILGTLVAERLLDVAVLVVLFVVVGGVALNQVGVDDLRTIVLVGLAGLVLAVAGWLGVRRSERARELLLPVAASTLALRSAHGLRLLGVTLLIWLLEAMVWLSAAHAVGFTIDPLEATYMVALACVFSLIPSGPGYAGTQDAAAILGAKSLGASGSTAVAYLVTIRFILVVPITLAGLLLLMLRYGGLSWLRSRRLATEAATMSRGSAA
jgi:glycosyltransferase 2 family protein